MTTTKTKTTTRQKNRRDVKEIVGELKQVLHHEKPHSILLPELLLKTIVLIQRIDDDEGKALVLTCVRDFINDHVPDKDDLLKAFDDYAPYLLDVFLMTAQEIAQSIRCPCAPCIPCTPFIQCCTRCTTRTLTPPRASTENLLGGETTPHPKE